MAPAILTTSRPLARFLAESLLTYLIDLDRPVRMAGQTNSAFALGLLLDYSDITRDTTIARAVGETAKRLFATDTDCATDTEAAAPEMVSPCLAEAALMSRVLDQGAFVAWFDKFMPPAHSNKFKPLRTVSLDAAGTGRHGGGRGQRGAGTANEDPTESAAAPLAAAQAPAQPPQPGAATPPATPWTLKLQGELLSWDDPDARRWATNLQPWSSCSPIV